MAVEQVAAESQDRAAVAVAVDVLNTRPMHQLDAEEMAATLTTSVAVAVAAWALTPNTATTS